MGVAAYYRGSRAISAQFCRERGCSGCSACSKYTTTPRPDSWGEKAYQRALARARGLLRVHRVMPDLGRFDMESIATVIAERDRVSVATATRALEAAMDEEETP